jgi:protein SCO1/2
MPAVASAALLLAGVLALAAALRPDTDAGPVPHQDIAGVTLFSPPAPIPSFELVDAHGSRFDEQGLRGHWTLMVFGYTSCPDFCPATLADMARTFDHLEAWPHAAESSRLVFVSVDPHRDTPGQLSSYLGYFDTRFVGVTGEPAALQRFTGDLGIHYEYEDAASGLPIRDVLADPAGRDPDGNDHGRRDYLVHHYAGVLLVDPQGRLAGAILPPLDAERFIPAYFAVRHHHGDPAS